MQGAVSHAPPSAIRTFLQTKSSGKLADGAFATVMVICALSIFAIVVLICLVLIANSRLSLHAFGLKFFASRTWDPVSGDFGALPFIYGTVVSSLLAVVMAVPLALASVDLSAGDLPEVSAGADLLSYRAAGRDSERGVWAVGRLCAGAD